MIEKKKLDMNKRLTSIVSALTLCLIVLCVFCFYITYNLAVSNVNCMDRAEIRDTGTKDELIVSRNESLKTEVLIITISICFLITILPAIIVWQKCKVKNTVHRLVSEQNIVQTQFANIVSQSYDRIYDFNYTSNEIFEYKMYDMHLIKETVEMGISKYTTDIIGNSCHPDDIEKYKEVVFEDSVRTAYENNRMNTVVKMRRMMDDGTYHAWIFNTYIYIGANKELCMMVYIKDVEEEEQIKRQNKKNLEDALAAANLANDAKSNFLSRMSHDIRTPMNAIIGMTSIAKAHMNEKDRVEDCLNKIDVSSKHLLKLINGILDMSRIESGKMNLTADEFNIDTVVQNVLDIISGPVNEKGHTLEVNMESINHRNCIGDAFRIQQILVNLLSNSIKYTHNNGHIILSISEQELEIEGIGWYEFIVEDNGIGMSEQFLKHIFEPFAMEADSRISQAEGTGLGMAITQNIVHLMNGEIKVESILGQGTKTTVKLYLKSKQIESQSIVSVKNESKRFDNICAKEECNFKGKKILVVDDNELNLEIVKEVICDMGAYVDCATNGKIATEMFWNSQQNYYDMILMDVQMRIMNGYVATETIRHMDRDDAKKIPIVAMTANAFAEDVERAKKAGMNEHIAKPLDINKLVNTIAQLMKGY